MHIHHLIPAALAALTLAACSVEETATVDKTETYYQDFYRSFGLPAKNQTWGFPKGTKPAVPFVKQNAPTGRDGHKASCDKQGNDWYLEIDYNDIPKPVTDTERERVVAAFRDPTWPALQPVAWSEFFVQQVFEGDTKYKVESWSISGGTDTQHDIGNEFVGSDKMDYITCYGLDNEHLKDFNHGRGGGEFGIASAQNVEGHRDFIVRVKNSDTREFSYGDAISQSAVDKDFILKMVDGAYYVGFNYTLPQMDENNVYTDTKEGKYMKLLGANDVYDDWIIKITPAIYKTVDETDTRGANGGRIICEDLGTTGDWDFNDLVLDVVYTKYENNAWTEPVATIRAAGGRLPLFVEDHEVHDLLGVPRTQITNTGWNSAPVAIFRLDGDYLTDDGHVDLGQVPIKVVQEDGTETLLQAYQGQPAAKIQVKPTYKWCVEKHHIKTAYPTFADYVANPTVNWQTVGAGQESNVMGN